MHAETFKFEAAIPASPSMTLMRNVHFASGVKHVKFENCLVDVATSKLTVVLYPWDANTSLSTTANKSLSVGHCTGGNFEIFPHLSSTALVLDYKEKTTFGVDTNLAGPYFLAIANCGAASVQVSGRFSTSGQGGQETEIVPLYGVFAILFGVLAITWCRFTDASCSLRQDEIWQLSIVTKTSFVMAVTGLIRVLLQNAAMDETILLDSTQYAATVFSVTTLPLVYLTSSSNVRPTFNLVFVEFAMWFCVCPVFYHVFKSAELAKPSIDTAYPAVAVLSAVLLLAAVRSWRSLCHLDEQDVEPLIFFRHLGLGALVYAVCLDLSAFAMVLDDPRLGPQVWKRHTIAHGLFLSAQFIGLLIIITAWRRHLRVLDSETKEQPFEDAAYDDEDDEMDPLCKEDGEVSAAVVGNALESGMSGNVLDDQPLE